MNGEAKNPREQRIKLRSENHNIFINILTKGPNATSKSCEECEGARATVDVSSMHEYNCASNITSSYADAASQDPLLMSGSLFFIPSQTFL